MMLARRAEMTTRGRIIVRGAVKPKGRTQCQGADAH